MFTLKKKLIALLLAPFVLSPLHMPQASAAPLEWSDLSTAVKELDEGAKSGAGLVCTFGANKVTITYNHPPSKYSGKAGDVYRLVNWDTNQSSAVFWSGSKWIERGAQWTKYQAAWSKGIAPAQASKTKPYTCIAGENKEVYTSALPLPFGSGVKDLDRWNIIDATNNTFIGKYIFSGGTWVASPNNPWFKLNNIRATAQRLAIASSAGLYCTYGKNKDVTSSAFTTPPASYKGATADLWVVVNKKTGAETKYYWSGKKWILGSSPGAKSLVDANKKYQYDARNSDVSEVCHNGHLVHQQHTNSNPPLNYVGNVGDSWEPVDAETVTFSPSIYWDGIAWVVYQE